MSIQPTCLSPVRGICITILIALGVCCLASQVDAQASAEQGDLPSRSASRPFFWVDTSSFLTDEGRPGVRVTVSVPYNQLHFVKATKGGYRAVIDVAAIFYDAKEKQVEGDVWRRRIRVRRYSDTSAQRKLFTTTEEFEIPPGQFALVVRVKNFDTNTVSQITRPIEIFAFEKEELVVTGLEIGTCADSLGRVVDAKDSDFVVSMDRSFGEPMPPVCARVEVFDPVIAEAEATMRLTLRVLDFEGEVAARSGYIFNVDTPRSAFLVDIPVESLVPGRYGLDITVDHDGVTASIDRDFEIDASRIDLARNYDDLLRLAELYLDEDLNELASLPVEERRAAWNAFWVDRDPNPDTERNELLDEFFRRIRLSASRFGARGKAGWATDRGRVYVRYGEPDDVENVPRGFNSPAYEIWRYVDASLSFTFADMSGFGDFVMVQPSPPPF